MRVISAIDDPPSDPGYTRTFGNLARLIQATAKSSRPPIREYAAVDLQLQTHADTIYGDPEYTRVTFRLSGYGMNIFNQNAF